MTSSRLFRTATMGASALVVLAWSGAAALAEGDPAAGEKTFKKCKACHVVDSDKHRVGPSLKGVFGRTPGTAELISGAIEKRDLGVPMPVIIGTKALVSKPAVTRFLGQWTLANWLSWCC